MDQDSEAGRRLGIDWINIAKKGDKSHPGKLVSDNCALLLFDKASTNQTMVALWDLSENRALASLDLNFPLGMLWDWDWRAESVEEAFSELCPSHSDEPTVDGGASSMHP